MQNSKKKTIKKNNFDPQKEIDTKNIKERVWLAS